MALGELMGLNNYMNQFHNITLFNLIDFALDVDPNFIHELSRYVDRKKPNYIECEFPKALMEEARRMNVPVYFFKSSLLTDSCKITVPGDVDLIFTKSRLDKDSKKTDVSFWYHGKPSRWGKKIVTTVDDYYLDRVLWNAEYLGRIKGRTNGRIRLSWDVEEMIENNNFQNESQLEDWFVHEVREAGGECMKLNPRKMGKGIPDQLVIFNGTFGVVEVKNGNRESLTPEQEKRIDKFNNNNINAYVLRRPEDINWIIQDIKG